MCAFSAANEIAVDAFLSEAIRFTDIDRTIETTLGAISLAEPNTLLEVQALDRSAREAAAAFISDISLG